MVDFGCNNEAWHNEAHYRVARPTERSAVALQSMKTPPKTTKTTPKITKVIEKQRQTTRCGRKRSMLCLKVRHVWYILLKWGTKWGTRSVDAQDRVARPTERSMVALQSTKTTPKITKTPSKTSKVIEKQRHSTGSVRIRPILCPKNLPQSEVDEVDTF